jgi:hypothetical protein
MRAMPDRIAYPAFVLLAAAMVSLAMVWPQGIGARSPAPFGHPLRPLASGAASAADSGSLLGLVAPTPPSPPLTLEAKPPSAP